MNDMSREGSWKYPLLEVLPESQAQEPNTSVPATTASEDGNPKFMFITERGTSSQKSADERKIIRKQAMQDIGRTKRRLPGSRPAHEPAFQIPLEIPPSFRWYHGETQAFSKTLNASSNSNCYSEASYELLNGCLSSPASFPVAPLIGSEQPDDNEQQLHHSMNHDHGTHVDWFGGGRRNLLFSFPIEMNARKHELLDHVFNDKLCKGSWAEAWRTTSSDPAVIYQLLYWSTLHLRWLRNPEDKEEPKESLVYYANAVRIIKGRIQDANEATSDVTIRLVIMLLFYNYCIGSIENWHIHMMGLKQMIQLRGGLPALNSNPALKYTLTRIDIGGSCLQDIPTFFPLPEGLSGLQDLEAGSVLTSDSWEWSPVFASNNELFNVFNHMRRLSALVNANVLLFPTTHCLQPSILNYRYVGPVIHMLLTAQKYVLKSNISYALHEALRLTGILYLAEIRRTLGVFPVWSAAQIGKLETLFLERLDQLNGECNLLPRLWIVTFAAIEAVTVEQRRLFEYEMRSTVELMGIQNYEQLEDVLKRFIYTETVHNTKLKALYASAIDGWIPV